MANPEIGRGRDGFPDELRRSNEGVENTALAREQDALWELLDEWKAGDPPASLDAAILAKVREENTVLERGWWSRLAGLWSPRGFALAGVVATLVLAMVMMRSPEVTPDGSATPGDSGTAVLTQDLSTQQVELALEDFEMLNELYSPATADDSPQNNKI